MTNEEKVMLYLVSKGTAVCDDCISMECEITPRQQVFSLTKKMLNKGMIIKFKDRCSICNNLKNVSKSTKSTPENKQIIHKIEFFNKKIPIPSIVGVNEYLRKWDSLENYVLQESSLNKLFHQTYPLNDNMDDVLIKVCSLNDFYSTNIFSPFNVAKRIIDLNIDNRLKNGDLTLVNDLAKVTIKDKQIVFYSFASKYCSHHYEEKFPIYDYYVEKVIKHFQKQLKFSVFNKDDFKEYSSFNKIIMTFRSYFNLESFTIKQLDKYLWLIGKEYFPRKYKNNRPTTASTR
jgi:hypothetical protein